MEEELCQNQRQNIYILITYLDTGHGARSYCGSATILGVERLKDLHCQLYHHPLAAWLWDLLSPELSLFY